MNKTPTLEDVLIAILNAVGMTAHFLANAINEYREQQTIEATDDEEAGGQEE